MQLIANIRQAIAASYSPQEAEAIARMVVEDIFHFTLVDCLTGRITLTEAQHQQLDAIVKRLQAGEPIQYIIGETTFHGCRIKVTPDVLIPRPETEDLVEIICHTEKPLRIFDACTGSGCIAIALKKVFPQSHVTGLDLSPAALEVARENARVNDVAVDFLQGDILDTPSLPVGPWNLIVSNPPYVMEQEKTTMATRVKDHEPSMALFVPDEDALRFYDALARWAQTALAPQGALYCEINSLLAEDTRQLFLRYGFTHTAISTDRYDNPRFVLCKR